MTAHARDARVTQCVICNKNFDPHVLHQVTCGDDCRATHKRNRAKQWAPRDREIVRSTERRWERLRGTPGRVSLPPELMARLEDRLGINAEAIAQFVEAAVSASLDRADITKT